MSKNIIIPVSNEQPIVLSGSVPSGGTSSLDIQYLTGSPDLVVDIADVTPKFEIDFNNTTYRYLYYGVFSTISKVISKITFHNEFLEIYDSPTENKSNFLYFSGTIIFKSVTRIGNYGVFSNKNIDVYIPKTLNYIGSDGLRSNGENSTVYYEGTEEEWNSIEGVENVVVSNIVFNTPIPN